MARYGGQYGPDLTFLGVPRCDLDDPATYADADVVIIGAPFDGGTSYRSGARFGPQALRMACYLAHDGSRPSLALRTDGLTDLRVVDGGDVEPDVLLGGGREQVDDDAEAGRAVLPFDAAEVGEQVEALLVAEELHDREQVGAGGLVGRHVLAGEVPQGGEAAGEGGGVHRLS